jgi:hypothetical protein
MSRYPAPLTEREWVSLMERLSTPTTEAYRKTVLKMIKNGKKLKVFI